MYSTDNNSIFSTGDIDTYHSTDGATSKDVTGCYNGYRFEVTSNDDYTWQGARDYCTARNGDLAYHGLDTISKRE